MAAWIGAGRWPEGCAARPTLLADDFAMRLHFLARQHRRRQDFVMSLPWRYWQRAPGSLSQRLAALGALFEVQRLSQGVQPLLPGEASDLRLPAGTRALVREVVLRVDGRALVWARSVVPAHATRGPWRALQGLGTRPLAALLFADPAVSRSTLWPEVWRRSSPWYRHASAAWLVAEGQPWPGNQVVARSSVFWRAGMPLRVFEAFAVLPGNASRGAARHDLCGT